MWSLLAPASRAARRPAVAVARRAGAARRVGTQTPRWRTRQAAVSKALAAAAGRLHHLPVAADAATGASSHPLLQGAAPGAAACQVGGASGAEGLARRAHAAAQRGDAAECLSLVWALKDLPREPFLLRAVDAPRGTPSKTLLQAAAASGLEGVVGQLLELGARVGTKSEEGWSALHLAAAGNHAEVARLLLARGRAHVDARDALGRTPLRLAAERDNGRSGRVLMRFGADASSVALDGQTPLQVAGAAPGDGDGEEGRRSPALSAGLGPWLRAFAGKRQHRDAVAGGALKTSHVVAPKLVLTAVGYCPEEDGKIKHYPRGIRCNKGRKGPTRPSLKINWYCPRG